MSATHASRALCFYAALSFLLTTATALTLNNKTQPASKDDKLDNEKIELFDGVSVTFGNEHDREGKLMSFEINTSKDVEEGRGKSKKLFARILPMFIVPFLIQSTIVPFFLSMLKFMLFKSMMVGKVALGLILLNAFKNNNSAKGRQDTEMASAHYGYSDHGMEYGAYIN